MLVWKQTITFWILKDIVYIGQAPDVNPYAIFYCNLLGH